jgi:phage repressor protein C with HTH and peptisase S24 domain
MDIKDIRRFRLRKLVLTRFGGKQSAFADAIGRSASYVARIFSENPAHSRNIGESLAREIEKICAVPTGFLDQPLTEIERMGAYDPATNPPGTKEFSLPPRLAQKIDAYKDHVSVPVMDIRASMGSGAQPPNVEIVASSMTLETDWLRRTVAITELSNLRIITGMGESMSPTIKHGDLLMVDVGTSSVSYDAVYVMLISDQLVIKRVQRELDGIRIISDNPKYKEIVVPADMEERVRILGRVVFVWSGAQV